MIEGVVDRGILHTDVSGHNKDDMDGKTLVIASDKKTSRGPSSMEALKGGRSDTQKILNFKGKVLLDRIKCVFLISNQIVGKCVFLSSIMSY